VAAGAFLAAGAGVPSDLITEALLLPSIGLSVLTMMPQHIRNIL
jgi:hypothetical protein